jgi:hypothetical protein
MLCSAFATATPGSSTCVASTPELEVPDRQPLIAVVAHEGKDPMDVAPPTGAITLKSAKCARGAFTIVARGRTSSEPN